MCSSGVNDYWDTALHKAIQGLEEKLKHSQAKLESKSKELRHLQKLVKLLNNGTTKLDEILSQGEYAHDEAGVGFKTGEPSTSPEGTSFKANFEKQRVEVRKNTSQKRQKYVSVRRQGGYQPTCEASKPHQKFIPVCHYCGRLGHIRPLCRFYLGDNRNSIVG